MGGGRGAGRNWVTCQLRWQRRSARKLWPIFQSKHDSLSRDAPEINSFPVLRPAEAGTTPSCGFVSGYCGYRSERLGGAARIKMAISKELAALRVLFIAWQTENCKQLEDLSFSSFFFFLFFPPTPRLQTINLLLLLASPDRCQRRAWHRHMWVVGGEGSGQGGRGTGSCAVLNGVRLWGVRRMPCWKKEAQPERCIPLLHPYSALRQLE